MQTDFEIRRSSRRCSVTGRDLAPGEWFYSALVETESGLERRDFAEASWSGPPESSIGWWRSRIATGDTARFYWAPSSVLLAYFERLLSDPARRQESYLMALVLVRKRLVQWREIAIDDQGQQWLVLHQPSANREYRAAIDTPTPQRADEIQAMLCEHLFVDHQPDESVTDGPTEEA